ncbi:MAG TPA: class I SAM-dependent methyltransferase, partial [Polyangia bacterium]
MSTSASATETTKLQSAFDMRNRTCPICDVAPDKVLGLRGGVHHRYGLGVETAIAQCARCSLVFPNPFPYALAAGELYGDPEKYFAHADEDAKVERFRHLAREAIRRSGKTSPRVLDVGSGRGELLRAFRAEGVEAVGLELSDAMIEHVRKKHGLTVRQNTLEDFADSTEETFDVVIMAAIIEHVYDPGTFMAAARKLTRPGSLVYIDAPCEPSLMTMVGNRVNRLLGKPAVFNLAPTFPPYHVFGFNPKSLRLLLDKHDFEVIDLKVWADPRIPASGGFLDHLKAKVATQINRVANLVN